MGFIRVRAAKGPRHEFDIPEVTYSARPDAYKVIDPEPVDKARAATFVTRNTRLPQAEAAGNAPEGAKEAEEND